MSRVVKNPSGYVSKGRTAAEKAKNFGEYAHGHGWEGKWSSNEEPHVVHLFCRRGENETIDIWWHANGSLMLDRLPVYSLAGEHIKLRNVSAAAARVASPPEEGRLRKAVRKRSKRIEAGNVAVGQPAPSNAVPTDEIDSYISAMAGSLPFDRESSDEEIKDVLLGRSITWVNRQSGHINSALVSAKPKQFKVVRNGHDYVSFVYPVQRSSAIDTYGFRAVYIDSIVSVS